MTGFVPLKRVARIRYGLGQPPPLSEEGIPIIRATNVFRGKISADNLLRAHLQDLPLDRAPLLHEGEILVVRSGAYTGDSARITSEWAGSAPGYDLRVTPHTVDSRFAAYALLSTAALDQIKLASTRAAQPHLNAEELGEVGLWLPSAEEQRRIADFLDTETARIDALVAHRHQQSELLRERFESLANSVTGRAAIRSGTLPDGWATQQLRRTITSIKTGTTPSSDDTEIWVERTRTDAVPWYGPSSIEGLLGLAPSLKRLPRSAIAERVVPKFPSGSVLVIGIGATAGKVAYLDHEGTGNQQITALVPEVDMVGRFLAWQLWAATDELRELAPYTTLPIINNDFLKNFPIAVPSAAHQRVVVKRLDLAASRLRALERTAQQATSLLAERRQALITAAVTGQFDASTASGRNVTDGVSA
ncbi:restriction endonuclease subunit S [Streptomyces mirabilis]|uniref:restriction endonuclease subunit S n=1 Tax=Streptomyces mirabilis TaxID=68239 RepID=UPI00099F0C4D